MTNAWVPKSVLLNGASQAVPASQTKQVVSKEFTITSGGALNMVIGLSVASVTETTALSAILQTKAAGGVDSWEDAKTVAITANDDIYIKLLVERTADQTHLPLGSVGRIVVTTGSGDLVTVTAISVIQEL